MQIDIYGRGNNAYRWAGETDVQEAVENFIAVEQLLGRGIPVLPTLVHDEPLCAPAPAEIAARRAVELDQWRCRDPARLTDMHAACVVAACRARVPTLSRR